MNTKLRIACICALPIVLGVGCFGGGGGGGGGWTADDIDPGNVTGMFAGTAWTLGTAVVEPDAFDDTMLSIDLFGEATAECDGFGDSELGKIIFSIPAAVGEYPLKLNLFDMTAEDSQTFTMVVPPSNNYIITEGIVTIDALTDTSITMGIAGEYDDDFHVNGTFTADLCGDDTDM